MSTSPIKDFLVTNLMPEKCFTELIVNFNLHVPCLTLVVNKIIGLWIFLDIVFVNCVNSYDNKKENVISGFANLFLILHYWGDTVRGMLFVLAYGGLIGLLGSCAPAQVISALQSSSLTAIIASKVLQKRTNYSNGHTGQLSSMSVLLSCTASLGLIFESLQDTGMSPATASYLMSACFSCILLAQVLCYGNGNNTNSAKNKIV